MSFDLKFRQRDACNSACNSDGRQGLSVRSWLPISILQFTFLGLLKMRQSNLDQKAFLCQLLFLLFVIKAFTHFLLYILIALCDTQSWMMYKTHKNEDIIKSDSVKGLWSLLARFIIYCIIERRTCI